MKINHTSLINSIREHDCKPFIDKNGGISIFFDGHIDCTSQLVVNNYNYIGRVCHRKDGTIMSILDADGINESASSKSNIVTMLSEALGYDIFEIETQLGIEIEALEWEKKRDHFERYVANKTAITKGGKTLVSYQRISNAISLEYIDKTDSGCPDWFVSSKGYKLKKKIKFCDLNLFSASEYPTEPRDFKRYIEWMINTNKGKNDINPYRTKIAIKTNKENFLKLKELARTYEKPFCYFQATEEMVKMDVPKYLEGYVRSMIEHHNKIKIQHSQSL